MPAPSDAARKWTDSELEALERRMSREYAQAAREMRGKQAEWLEKFNREREHREKALDSTREAMEAHKRWLQSQAARGDWLDGMATQLAQAATEVNQRSMEELNGALPLICAENANMAAFAIDRELGVYTGFTLVNEDAVRYLMGLDDQPLIHEVVGVDTLMRDEYLPRFQSLTKRVDVPRDIRWNRQKFTSAITQGILQGESIPNIVKRTDSIFGMNRAAATRAVRTAVTGAENMGIWMSGKRAQEMGIDIGRRWSSAHDGRVRDSHRMLDGEVVGVDEPFQGMYGEIMYPGDPQAEPAETYNCRCRVRDMVLGFDGKRGDWVNDERLLNLSKLPDGVDYEAWKSGVYHTDKRGRETKASMRARGLGE